MCIKKHLNFVILYNKNEKIPIDFLIDEIGVDFFKSFLDVYLVQNKFLRLSKRLLRETYSSKCFTFEPSIEYQSFKLTAELNLSKEEFLFILEIFWMWSKKYMIIYQSLFLFPTRYQNLKPLSCKIVYSFTLTIFKAQNLACSGLESDFQRFAFKNSSTSNYHLKFTSKSKNLTTYLNISNFYLITYNKFN